MRLIDADALFEAFSNSKHIKETTDGLDVMEMLAIKEIIDNASTVDVKITHDVNSAYDKGFIAAKKLYSRPQGAWIIVDDTENVIVKCSVCGRTEDSHMIKYYPFCHCGARMKG